MSEMSPDHDHDPPAVGTGSACNAPGKRRRRGKPIDGRTREARRLAELERLFLAPLGDDVTEADRVQAGLAAALAVAVEGLKASIARREPVDPEHATRLANAAQRALTPLRRRTAAKVKPKGMTAREYAAARQNGGEGC